MEASEQTLREYAAGGLGTRQVIERLGLNDFADLVIALAAHNLDLPRPAQTAAREINLARAQAILQPRLRNAG